MLTFVGLGLYDERSITIEGQQAVRNADRIFAEFYTSRLAGTTLEELEAYHSIEIELRDRAGVEQEPEPILDAARTEDVVFLTAGDAMVATTHVDLRLRAAEREIPTRVIHGTSAGTAAAGLTGLQSYRFGKTTTLPFERAHGGDGVPESVLETISANRDRGLHTLVLLDIKVDDPRGKPGDEQFMRAETAAEMFADAGLDGIGVVVARAGSPEPVVEADRLDDLADRSFGDPLHMLVLPGELHHIEADALAGLAGAPEELVYSDLGRR